MPKLKVDPKIIREDGLVTMHFLGAGSRAMWFVPGQNHAYEVGVDAPYFVVLPEHVEPLSNFVYKGKKLFEVVPPEEEPEEEDNEETEGQTTEGAAPKAPARKTRQKKS